MPQQKITINLIKDLNGVSDFAESGLDEKGEEERIESMISLKKIRLELCCIHVIENLEIFSQLLELYLQFNRISKIEGLDTLLSLEILSLASNQICKLENLKHLTKLNLLDISSNQIAFLDAEELPDSLQILDLQHNQCCNAADYQSTLTEALPKLMILDGTKLGDGSMETSRIITLQVPVIDRGAMKIIPLSIRGDEDMQTQIEKFCKEHDIEESPDELIHRMEISFGPKETGQNDQSDDEEEEDEDTGSGDEEGSDGQEETKETVEEDSKKEDEKPATVAPDFDPGTLEALLVRYKEEDRQRAVLETSLQLFDEEASEGLSYLRHRAERTHQETSHRIEEIQKGSEGQNGQSSSARLEEARRFVQEQQRRRRQEHLKFIDSMRGSGISSR